MTAKRPKRAPKATHGGARVGAGPPVTTGAASVKPVFFRVSKEEREDGEALAKARGLRGINALARAAFASELTGAKKPT